jgi:arsenate reductase (glutaredoxin)
LRALISRIGLDPHELLSKRSRPYKALGLADREIDDEELIKLMVEHPALIRRPLVVRGDRVVVGFDQRGLADLIKSK